MPFGRGHDTIRAAPMTPAQTAAITPQALIADRITPELIALNRMAFGPHAGDLAAIAALGGLTAYIDQQLNPASIDDSACEAKLSQARIRIQYTSGNTSVNETRPLVNLAKTTTQLWQQLQSSTVFNERIQPLLEVRVAMLIRAAYSARQLEQVLVDFWHNHFNIRPSSDTTIAATFPAYHAIIRKHALGNFRTFLEEIGKSTAMLYDLDNVSNRASGGEGGNENYARELFELQTLGSENYFKFYDDRNGIGTVTYNGETFARGYIDDDVYETAACFTGWTVANGDWRLPTNLANDGSFYYYSSWHDTRPKTVLSIDGRPTIPSKQAVMKDGQDVYDLLARHIGTARRICTKLCRRLVADDPPIDLVEAATAEWMASRNAPDQIKRVVRVILTSSAFQSIWGQKVKRPFEFLVSFIRAAGIELILTDDSTSNGSNWGNILRALSDTGHGLYEWPTPTGYPDLASFWANSNGTLRRWSMPALISQNYDAPSTWEGNVQLLVRDWTKAAIGANATSEQVIDYWIGRIFGYQISSTTRTEMIAFLAQGQPANQPPKPLAGDPDWGNDAALTDRFRAMLQLLAMTPEFQWR